jgi:L-ascorbate metabolism protein UlaG (beta-lactamase superfamily)
MRLTKHAHACLELLDGGERLIIDPGVYTAPMDGMTNVKAIVITHQHDDHCWEVQLERIIALNPGVPIFAPSDVCERLAKAPHPEQFNAVEVHHGDLHLVGAFQLEFFGEMHAEIHRSIPLVKNCGVMVNDELYYPGDSFTRPDRPVAVLACPSSAPWLKIGEVIDFVDDVKPGLSFATHNIHLSEQGHQMNNGRIQALTERHGGQFRFLQVGEVLDY